MDSNNNETAGPTVQQQAWDGTCTGVSPERGRACTGVSPERGRAESCTDIFPKALAFIASRSGRSPVCSSDVDMDDCIVDAIGVDMEHLQCAHVSHENYGADNEVRRTKLAQPYRPQNRVGETHWHTHIVVSIRPTMMADANSPISHSQPICARMMCHKISAHKMCV